MRRVLMSLAAVAVLAGSSEAGPIRNIVQRIRGGGCGGGCQTTAAPVQYGQPAPAVTMPQTGALQLVTRATSYHPPEVTGGPAYQPILLTAPLPTTCVGPNCR